MKIDPKMLEILLISSKASRTMKAAIREVLINDMSQYKAANRYEVDVGNLSKAIKRNTEKYNLTV